MVFYDDPTNLEVIEYISLLPIQSNFRFCFLVKHEGQYFLLFQRNQLINIWPNEKTSYQNNKIIEFFAYNFSKFSKGPDFG